MSTAIEKLKKIKKKVILMQFGNMMSYFGSAPTKLQLKKLDVRPERGQGGNLPQHPHFTPERT